MPLGTKLLMVFSTIIFFLNQFFEGSLGNALSYYPYDIVTRIQIWRLLFSPIFAGSLVSLLLSYLTILNLLVEREKSQGTVLFLIELFFKSMLINILITLFYFIELHTYLISYFYPQNGMWNLFFYYCAVKCQQNPDFSTNIYITNITIFNKYIPVVMILFFFIFSNPVGPIISTLFGFIDGAITQGAPCRFIWVSKLELKLCNWFSSIPGFIKNAQAIQPNNHLQILKFDLSELLGKPQMFASLPVTISSSANTAVGLEMNVQPNIERMLAYAKEQQQEAQQEQQQDNQQQQQPQDLL